MDLRVSVSNDLKPSKHISHILKKSQLKASYCKKTVVNFRCLNKEFAIVMSKYTQS